MDESSAELMTSGEPARWRDPRLLVVVAVVVALTSGAVAARALQRSVDGTLSSVEYVVGRVAPVRDHLARAERANAEGRAALLAAVNSTGAEREQFLNESVMASQEISAAWAAYLETAIGLPGESELAAQFSADLATAESMSSAALVPILNSSVPAVLPPELTAAHEAVSADLQELQDMYSRSSRGALTDFAEDARNTDRLLSVLDSAMLIAVASAGAVAMRHARRSVREREERRAALRLASFDARLRRALDLVEDDRAAFAVGERGLREMAAERPTSLLIADSSRATLTPVSDAPACGVTSPDACPALRSTTTVVIGDSAALDACPQLAAHADRRCSATCVPVTVAGRAAAVLQIVGEPGAPSDADGAATLVANGVGDRVTILQALATFQLQAAKDPLTGLLNRRSLHVAVEKMLASEPVYAVAYCDLDHFKALNDLHGHDAGDRGLRTFARHLTGSLRPQDIICRWGGEEFVVVLPGCDAPVAAEAMERVRTNLALGSLGSEAAVFTASFGVAESDGTATFDEIVNRADTALHEAKATGRDRVVTFDPSAGFSVEAPQSQDTSI